MKTALVSIGLFALLGALMFGGYELLAKVALKPQPPPTPDFSCPDGVGVYTHGMDAGALCMDEALIYAQALKDCPPAHQEALQAVWKGLSITLAQDNFPCASSTYGCHGIQEGSFITIGSHRALVDEMGHVFWEVCFGRTGETLHLDLPDGGSGEWTKFDPKYQSWVVALYPAIQ